MIDIHLAFRKAKKLDLSDWRRLVLLALGSFLLGISLTFLDVGSVSLFLKTNTFHAIGVDFLAIALCLVWVGSIAVKLDRQHGYGGVPLVAFLTIILFALLRGIDAFPGLTFPINVLFIYKYLLPILVSYSFWTITSRFIVLKLNSLKYLGVLSGTLAGFFVGGFLLLQNNWTPKDTITATCFVLILLVLVMKILVWLLPQPGETFIRKTGGVQDSSEQKMIDCILMLSFVYTASRVMADYLLYQHFGSSSVSAYLSLSRLWMNFGGIGFFVLAILSYTRFLYTTLWGLFTLCLGFFFLAEGSFLNLPFLLYGGTIVVWICGFLYWSPYLSLLPRPLTLGEGIRLRKKRQMLIEPLGFVLVGAFVLTLPRLYLAPILALSSILLMGLIWLSVILYSRLLSRFCRMRLWCGGPLMLVSDKLIQRVKKGAESDSLMDVSYFLRIMEVAHFPGFPKQLLKALHHLDSQVRLFALDKLDEHSYYKNKIIQTVRRLFQKDEDNLVRARALAFLIHYESNYNLHNLYHKYGTYLDDKNLKIGAITGFLQAGGEWALLAMDGLQKMVLSSNKNDNLTALKIIEKVPQEGLVRLVLPLLKSSHLEVAQFALLVAGRIGHTQSLSFVLQALDNPQLQEYALIALSLYGKKVFPPIEKMIQSSNVSFSRRKSLILFLELLSSGEGKQVLLRNLYLSDQKMRKEVFNAILNSKIIWVSRRRKKILEKGIRQDVEWWHSLNKSIQLCQQVPSSVLGDSFSFLRNAFQEMKQDLRDLILYQLELLKPNSLVRKTIRILRGYPSQRFISASGILQDLLPSKTYRMVEPILLSPISEVEEEKVVPMDIKEAKYFLEQLILSPTFPVNRWMLASALYGLQKVGDEQSKIVLNETLKCPSKVVLDASLDLLTHLEPDKKKQENYLNAQIHKVPKNLILDDYLNHRRKNDYL